MKRPSRYNFLTGPSCRMWTMTKGGKDRTGGPAEEWDDGTKFYWAKGHLVFQEWGDSWRKWHSDSMASSLEGPCPYKRYLLGYGDGRSGGMPRSGPSPA